MERLGRYTIVDQLGEGGMAVVHRARDETLGREVALKVLHEELVGEEHHRRRLLREAQAVAALNHQTIATVYEVGEADGRLFIAMELLEGETLSQRLSQGSLQVDRALSIAIAVAEALEHAHGAGIIHRDIKPENIMLVGGQVKVLDFGIARTIGREAVDEAQADTALTRDGMVIGTPGYMSPEQITGLPVDETCDLFALGVTLYRMLGNAMPFGGTTLLQLAVSVARDEPRPLSSCFAQAWPALEDTVAHCLKKTPEARIRSANELRTRLQTHLAEWRGGPPTPSALSQVSRTSGEDGLSRRAWSGLLLLTLGAVAAGVFWWAQPPAASSAASASASRATAAPAATRIIDLPAPQTRSPEATAAYRRALAALRDGAWPLARKELEEALRHDSSLPEAHLRLMLLDSVGSGRGSEIARAAYRLAIAGRKQLHERDARLLQAFEPVMAREPPEPALHREQLYALAERYPQDAEIAFLAAWSAHNARERTRAMTLARRAVKIDPQYADGWQALAKLQLSSGELKQAELSLGRCIELSPNIVDCLAERARLHAHAARCDAALADTRLSVKRDNRAVSHRQLGMALLGANKPMTAAEAALTRAASRAEGTESLVISQYQVNLAIVRGDFERALTLTEKLRQRVADSDESRHYAAIAWQHAELLDEMGRGADARAEAKRFLAERLAVTEHPFSSPRQDPAMFMWALRMRAGDVEPDSLDKARDAWLSRWRERQASRTSMWIYGWVAGAHNATTAALAVKQQPDELMLYEELNHPEVWAMVGRVRRLAGDDAAAAEHLRVAAEDCRLLQAPIWLTRTHYDLGRALQRRDKQAACRAYGVVLKRWGKAPSLTARAAATAAATLNCGPLTQSE